MVINASNFDQTKALQTYQPSRSVAVLPASLQRGAPRVSGVLGSHVGGGEASNEEKGCFHGEVVGHRGRQHRIQQKSQNSGPKLEILGTLTHAHTSNKEETHTLVYIYTE